MAIVSEKALPRLHALQGKTQIIALGEESLDLAEMCRYLYSEHGIHRMNLLGGPNLNGMMLDARLMDEVFMTLAPKIQGGGSTVSMIEGTGFEADQMIPAKLLSLSTNENEVYLRYELCWDKNQ